MLVNRKTRRKFQQKHDFFRNILSFDVNYIYLCGAKGKKQQKKKMKIKNHHLITHRGRGEKRLNLR